MEILEGCDIKLDTMRIRSFPFSAEVEEFIINHEKVFLVEQNRDGQLRSLLVNECQIDPARIIPILNYDGFPITAKSMVEEVLKRLGKTEDKLSSNFVAAE